MKIKSLLVGMLACTALVGCTDDALDNGTESGKQSELVRGDAYVSIVINTATNSSRGTTTSTTSGDSHGNSEDSGHSAAAVATENNVNELLLVIAKVDDSTEALYGTVMTEATNKVANGYVGYPAFEATDNSVKMTTPIRLDYTGKYKVLAVINPAEDLKNNITAGGDHKAAYETILNHEGTAAYKTITKDDNKEELSFQMSNQSECLITATAQHNTPANPIVAKISVERTTSKTTWRSTNATGSATVPEGLKDKENLYAVKVNVGKATATTANYWFKEAITDGDNTYDAYYFGYQLNKATHTDGNTYWVLLNSNFSMDDGGKISKDDVTAIFKDAFWTKSDLKVLDDDNKYTGVIDDQAIQWTDDSGDGDKLASIVGSEETAQVLKDDYKDAKALVTDEFIQGLTFEYNMVNADPEYYFVNLTHYALTNLADKVYAVRHTEGGGIMEALNNNWLVTPTLTYNNTLDNVNAEAAKLTSNNIDASTTFKALPTSKTGRNDGTTETGDTDHDGTGVGYFMEYLMENAPNKNISADNITGIVLVGNIYDEDGVAVPVLYKYNQKYYRSLRALVNANTLTYKVNDVEYTLTENSTDDQAKAAGVDVYDGGRCFYYSSGIKHYEDNEDANYGVMEYAIMRNNIYSLAVSGVSEIGDAQLTLTPSTPIEDIRSYVTLEVSILPWIVRFNDIKL